MALGRVVTLLCLSFIGFSAAVLPKYPVILVPGDGGSQLFAKLDRKDVPHFYCVKKTSDYFNIWLNLEELSLPIDCFVDNMRLRYNRTSHTTSNAEGVDIRIDQFGETTTVEWLDPDAYIHRISQLSYFYSIVEALVAQNYTRNKNIRGAPYDFRLAPNELGSFYSNLTKLIEDTYAENGNTSVVVIGHSMGNPVMLYFYNHKPQDWKDKYIRAHISLAGVWAGAVKTVRLMTSGDSLGVYVVRPLTVRPEQRAMPSTAWLLPSNRFWGKDEILVYTQRRNYTVNDFQQLFEDLNYTDGYLLWKDTQGLIIDLEAPNVELHGLYGVGIDTPGALQFDPDGFPDVYPITVPDSGDGTVNKRSLEAFLSWSGKQKQLVKSMLIKDADHMQILQHPQVLQYIVNFLLGKS